MMTTVRSLAPCAALWLAAAGTAAPARALDPTPPASPAPADPSGASDAGSRTGPTPTPAPPGEATPPGSPAATPSNELFTARAEGPLERLRFLLGSFAVAWSDAPGTEPAPPPREGSLTTRWELGGRLLFERWSVGRGRDEQAARVLWSWDAAKGQLTLIRFDTEGAAGDAYRVRFEPDGTAVAERALEGGGTDRFRYVPGETRAGTRDLPRTAIVRREIEAPGGTVETRFEARLTRR